MRIHYLGYTVPVVLVQGNKIRNFFQTLSRWWASKMLYLGNWCEQACSLKASDHSFQKEHLALLKGSHTDTSKKLEKSPLCNYHLGNSCLSTHIMKSLKLQETNINTSLLFTATFSLLQNSTTNTRCTWGSLDRCVGSAEPLAFLNSSCGFSIKITEL